MGGVHMGEGGVPRHWAFNRKTFHRLSKNPNDFSRQAGFWFHPPHELPTPAAIKPTACLECRTWLLQHTSHTGQKILRLRIFFYIDWSHFDPILPSVTIKETRVALHARCSDVHPDPERYGMLNDS